ncbi:MAG TPA: CopD family protein [Gammaproteobacteria bacterium]|nr:CopD family protein [Gammaproteobacteria bacterium]
MGIAVLLHVLAVVVWVGGMFFAYMVLRPVAAGQLEPPARLTLWAGVFARFFPWVFAAIAVILVTGLWMVYSVSGGFSAAALYINLMFWLGIVMMLIFFHVYFAPYRRLRAAVAQEDWPTGGSKLAQIRMLVGINTLLGLVVIAIGAGGRLI